MDTATLTVPEAAALLGLTESRVRQLLRAGELPGRRKGPVGPRGWWEILRADLEKFERRPVGRPQKTTA